MRAYPSSHGPKSPVSLAASHFMPLPPNYQETIRPTNRGTWDPIRLLSPTGKTMRDRGESNPHFYRDRVACTNQYTTAPKG